MAYEFQKLSDVTLAETAADTAHVLIEEEGEIKRVPKKEVGGAGAYVVKLTMENSTIDSGDEGLICTCSENYDAFYDIVKSGGLVCIDITEMYVGVPEAQIPEGVFMIIHPTAWAMDPKSGLGAIGMFMDEMGVVMFPNGSHHTPTTE